MKCSISFILISFLQLARTLQAIILIYKQQNLPPRVEKKNSPLNNVGFCQQNARLQLQETQRRLLQILNTSNQRITRKCSHEHHLNNLLQAVWCHREVNIAGMRMHRPEFSGKAEMKSNRMEKTGFSATRLQTPFLN